MLDMLIDKEYLLETCRNLLAVSSPSGDCLEAVRQVADAFKKLSLTPCYSNKKALYTTLTGSDTSRHLLVAAHIDTLGAVVREIKDNGRLKLSPIGGFAWSSLQGENCRVVTLNGNSCSGSLMPVDSSFHLNRSDLLENVRDQNNVEVRIDEDIQSAADVRALGINCGDFVHFATRTEITESGYIKSRYLDDKICVAIMLAALKYMTDNAIAPLFTTTFYISNFEETGHGISALPSADIDTVLALDIGLCDKSTDSSEKTATIVAKDGISPYDLSLRQHLTALAKRYDIPCAIDVYSGYGSDATALQISANDVMVGCIGPAVDGSHHYERTHIEGVTAACRLLLAFLTHGDS